MKRLDISVISICIIAVIVMVMVTVSMHTTHTEHMAQIASEANTTQSNIASTDERVAKASNVDATKVMSSAKEAGDKVAELQNEYLSSNIDPFSEEGRAKLSDIADRLSVYRGNTAFQQSPWLSSHVTGNMRWTFRSGYDFEGDKLACAWTCYPADDSADNRLVACAFATYSADDGKFYDSEVYFTTFGKSLMTDTTVQPAPEEADPYAHLSDEGVTASGTSSAR